MLLIFLTLASLLYQVNGQKKDVDEKCHPKFIEHARLKPKFEASCNWTSAPGQQLNFFTPYVPGVSICVGTTKHLATCQRMCEMLYPDCIALHFCPSECLDYDCRLMTQGIGTEKNLTLVDRFADYVDYYEIDSCPPRKTEWFPHEKP